MHCCLYCTSREAIVTHTQRRLVFRRRRYRCRSCDRNFYTIVFEFPENTLSLEDFADLEKQLKRKPKTV